MSEQVQPTGGDVSFARLIGTSIATKLMVDSTTQIFNPFLHIIALGLGTDVVTLGRLLGLRSAVGMLSPFFGALADRRGYRLVIRMGLLLNAAGMLLVGISTNLWMTTIGLVLAGLGVSSFIPTLQAYVSAKLPYAQRARALGMVEYAWALTGIVGLSVIGWLMAITGWRTPFFILSGGLVVMSFVFAALPDVESRTGVRALTSPRSSTSGSLWTQTRAFFDLGANARSTYSTIFAGTLTYLAAFQIMLIYGTWLGDQYGLNAAALGTVALVLGIFDLAASVSVSLFTDRIGKRRSVLWGNALTLLGYILLPLLNTGVLATVFGIALARGCFEFTIVSHFPLLSEQSPAQRGKVMTLGSAVVLGGGTIANFSGPWLYTRYGVVGVCVVSAVIVCLAIGLLRLWVKDGPEETIIISH